MMSDEYRIRVGTWTERDMTEDYAVNRFPAQADQGGLQWYNPQDPGSVFGEVAEVVTALDGSRGGFGGYTFSWVFGLLTMEMVKYLRQTIFDGGWNATVTVRTYDRGYGWRVINCKAHWNDLREAAEPDTGNTGYVNLRLDFTNGADADSGYGISRTAFRNGAFG